MSQQSIWCCDTHCKLFVDKYKKHLYTKRMQYTKLQSGYMVRISKGEDISQSLLQVAKKENIQSGFFQAIGGVSELTLGYYDLEKKEYLWKEFTPEFEIVSLTGNISLVDGQQFLHMHGVFSDSNFSCIGGHVKEGKAGATVEVYITPFEKPITRVMDQGIGLKLLQCEMEI